MRAYARQLPTPFWQNAIWSLHLAAAMNTYVQLLGLLAKIITTASGTDLGSFVFSSDDSLNGSTCEAAYATFDCNPSGSCARYMTLESCLARCDADDRCRWVSYGWDTSMGGFWRCANFQACPTKGQSATGDLRLYYKEPRIGSTTYDLAFENTYCAGNLVFDCYQDGSSLLETYKACHPEFYDLSNCQAECDSHEDCNFMLWGYDWGGDFFRCTLFDRCSGQGEYLSGNPRVWRKTNTSSTLMSTSTMEDTQTPPESILSPTYSLKFVDQQCPEERLLFDCTNLGNDDASDCAAYSERYSCEAVCEARNDCRFYTWGWDFRGYWRCITFSSCEQQTYYGYGYAHTYERPTEYQQIKTNAFCAMPILFDCLTSVDASTACSNFELLADCETVCTDDPACSFFSWGRDYGLEWRCTTFESCTVTSPYEGGIVSSYVHVLRTAAPTPAPTFIPPPPPEPIYCVRIVTGSMIEDGGGLNVSVDAGNGYGTVELQKTNVPGGAVLDLCYSYPVQGVQLSNPSDDAWAGSVEHSMDGGSTFMSMLCEVCTVAASAAKVVVDGNGDEVALAPTQCLNREVCRFIPRAQFCVRSITGSAAEDDGALQLEVYSYGLLWTTGQTNYTKGAYVGEKCFSTAIFEIFVKNPTGDSWTGTIMYSTNFGMSYSGMLCRGCIIGEDTFEISVGTGADEILESTTLCIAWDSCVLTPKKTNIANCPSPETPRFQLDDTNTMCAGGTLFDCNPNEEIAGAQCHQFATESDCQAVCEEDMSCRYFLWARDVFGYNRCITFSSCVYRSKYQLGLASLYKRLADMPSDINSASRGDVLQSVLVGATTLWALSSAVAQ